MAGRLQGRVDRLCRQRRAMGPCSICGGRGRINVFLFDEDGADIGGAEPPGGCPECGEVLRLEFRRVTRIKQLWH